jgi:4-amino-4-deoxy-L-arabinose transferase-like glycosyltransferase
MVPPMAEPEPKVDPLADTAALPLVPADAPRAPLPVRWRELALVAALLGAIYLPFLGSSQLWDPWETHYGEVARRMLEDHDWVRLQWQHESFRSKPVLTFWFMAAGMKLFGLAQDGGYSGELAMSEATSWAIRLPFCLSGIAALVLLWFTLARLHSRRLAWIGTGVLATCPFYLLISRQAITDMPSCAMLIASMALFMLAVWDDGPLPARKPGRRFALDAQVVFLIAFAIVVVPQLVYFFFNVTGSKWYLSRTAFLPGPLIMLPFAAAYAAAVIWIVRGPRTRRQVYMDWFFLVNGIAVLAKGPVAPGLTGLTLLLWFVVTGEWKLLRTLGLVRGAFIACVVCLPWHFAMFLRDGLGWLNEYVSQHLLGRVFKGAHGDRGTFEYYAEQLGVGMWPWVALIPAALAHLAMGLRPRTREQHLRLLFAIWAIAGFAFFTFTQTKFHHYILPTVPALAMVVAFWIDDLLDGRVARPGLLLVASLVLFAVTTWDILTRHERFTFLFTYRYDRDWPYEPPWSIDLTPWVAVFAGLFLVALVLLATRFRRLGVYGLLGSGAGFMAFLGMIYLTAAAPHWGQRDLHQVYYAHRDIQGIDLYYFGGRELAEDWKGPPRDLEVRSYVPDTLRVGAPMKVGWKLLKGRNTVVEQGELTGKVATLDAENDRFTIALDPGEWDKMAAIAQKNPAAAPARRRRLEVRADRMLAWQLFWRGENFYSGGEIWRDYEPDMQTVFNEYIDTGEVKFKTYLESHRKKGVRVWAITELRSLAQLKGKLPTEASRKTFRQRSESSNKFGLVSYQLPD